MGKRATTIHLTSEDERILRKWIKQATDAQVKADRARIVLMAARKVSTQEIATTLHKTAAQVSKWRTRFAAQGIAGLENAVRPGRPKSYDASIEARILALLAQPPPHPHKVWTGPLIADIIGDVAVDYVWRVLRTRALRSARRKKEKE